jgi:DNA polymerase
MTRREFTTLVERARACRACDSMHHVHVLSSANGPLDADVIFVAEAPGRLGAARTGVPLTSDVTGRRFDAFLAHAGIDRSRVFITNAVLCNPLAADDNNRRPSAREVDACSDLLREQLSLVRAPYVVALGSVALGALNGIERHSLRLSRDVGVPSEWWGRTLVALYHPGIRSTLTRSHQEQMIDWHRLGMVLSSSQS